MTKTLFNYRALILFVAVLKINFSYAQLKVYTITEVHDLRSEPCAACALLLDQGIKEELSIKKGNTYVQDIKTFFTSSRFLKEYREGKWQGDAGFAIDGVPIDFGFGKSDQEIKALQEKIKNATHITTNSNFYEYYLKSTFNTNLSKDYNKCLVDYCKPDSYGVFGVGSNTKASATFIITYRDKAGRPATVRTFIIKRGGKRVPVTEIANGYNTGERLQGERLITCPRNPKEEMNLTLSTTAGDVVINIESENETALINTNVPIGTVITSFLNFEQFNAATNNNEHSEYRLFSPSSSYWSPCDGRNVVLSRYSTITNEQNVPDLRGIFVRGLNSFDPNEKEAVDQSRKDPDDRRTAFSGVQQDALQNHKHVDGGHKHPLNAIFGYGIVTDNDDGRDATGKPSLGTMETGYANISGPTKVEEKDADVRIDTETRPKNIAVYYYIRIN